MLARIINDLAGLATDTEAEEDSEDESRANSLYDSSPPSLDAAHLTPTATAPLPQSQFGSEGSDRRPGRWSNIMNGAKRIIDNIIDIADSDTESPERRRSSSSSSSLRKSYSSSSLGKQFTRQGSLNNNNSNKPPPAPPAGISSTPGFPTISRDTPSNSEADLTVLGDTTAPTLLQAAADQPLPLLSEPSALLEDHHIRGLVAEIPLRYRQSTWKLVYSTARDGISMQTLLRNARGKAPTVLVVRDMGKSIFGAFCSEPWKISPRYYGTGETFVFQVSPREVVWHWWWKKAAVQQNDYFMWGSGDAVAVGGAGGYALWLDSELATGISRNSITFGNDSLSSQEEFRIGAVELWWLE